MNLSHEIAEALASALSLRASANACGPEHGALKFRLVHAAESLDAMVALAVRGLDRIAEIEQQLTTPTAGGTAPGGRRTHQARDDGGAIDMPTSALTIAGAGALGSEDCELILRALDVLDGLMRDELVNKQQAALINIRSRLLIVRAKMSAIQGLQS